jgi:hypothetical protein
MDNIRHKVFGPITGTPASAPGGTPSPAVRILAVLLCLVPVAGVFWFTVKYRYRVPYWDEWEMVIDFQRFHDGTLRLLDLMDQNGEHRMFFPRLIFLALAALTKWEMLAENLLADSLLILMLAVVYLRASRQFGFAAAAPPLWFVPVAFVALSWRQYEIMLWGMLMANVIPVTLGLLSFYSLEKLMDALASNSGAGNRRAHGYFAAALVCATIAAFSFGNGLILWPCALMIFVLAAPRKDIVKTIGPYVFVWLLAAAIEGYFYSIGFSKPPNSSDVFMAFKSPEAFIVYFLCVSGGLMPGIGKATAYGSLLIASAALFSYLAVKHGALRRNAFWLTFLFYALVTLAAISAGRFGYGIGQAQSPRYALSSVILVVSLFMLSMDIFRALKPGAAKTLLGLLSAVIILTPIVHSYNDGYVAATRHVRGINRASLDVLLRYRCVSDKKLESLNLYLKGHSLRGRLETLENLGYGIFRPRILHSKYPEYPSCDESPK